MPAGIGDQDPSDCPERLVPRRISILAKSISQGSQVPLGNGGQQGVPIGEMRYGALCETPTASATARSVTAPCPPLSRSDAAAATRRSFVEPLIRTR